MILILLALISIAVAIHLLWQRSAALEGSVANLQGRITVLEGARLPVPRVKVEHPPVVERTPASSKPAVPGVAEPSPTAAEVAAMPRPPAQPRRFAREVTPDRDSLEAVIGSRWLLYVGVAAIVIGAAYFQKLAMDNHWINETARVIEGAIAGGLLVIGGLRLVRRGFAFYGQMLSGCGVAVLYISTYAAFNFYHLIGRPPALVLMCSITALAAWLSDRQRSQALAILAVGGGFATPFLLPPAADAQLALFSYETVLIGGTMFLAHRRTWPMLNLVSYGFTVLTVAAWMASFYTASQYLPTEFFLTLFCGMFLYVLHASPRAARPVSTLSRGALWTAPFLYYLASLVTLASHPLAELVFLILLSLTGAGIGLRNRADARRSADLRLLFWLAAAAPLLVWTDQHQDASWLLPGLVTIAAVYAIHLVAHFESTLGDDRSLTRADLALLHLNALFAFGAAYWQIGTVASHWSAPLALLLACWHGAIARSVWQHRPEHALHFAAVAFTLLMCAIGLQFDGAWMTMGWAAEGAAIVALGLVTGRGWLRTGGWLLYAIALLRLLGLQMEPAAAGQIVFFNERAASGLFTIGLTYWLAWLHRRRALPERRDGEVAMVVVLAKLLILSFLTAEIDAYWSAPGARLRYIMAREGLVSITWATVGAVIVWLGLTRERIWIRTIGAFVLLFGMIRLVALEFATPASTYVVFANARLLASAVAVALLYALAARYREAGSIDAAIHPRALLLLAANLLTLLFLTSEIFAYWAVNDAIQGLREAQFARGMLLSMTWAAYATALVVAGIRKQYAPIRYLAFAIFGVTIFKVFAVDLSELDRIYRVSSIIALGVTLLVTSFLYHRFRARLSESTT